MRQVNQAAVVPAPIAPKVEQPQQSYVDIPYQDQQPNPAEVVSQLIQEERISGLDQNALPDVNEAMEDDSDYG